MTSTKWLHKDLECKDGMVSWYLHSFFTKILHHVP